MDGLVGGPLLVAGLVTPGPPVHPALVRYLPVRLSVPSIDIRRLLQPGHTDESPWRKNGQNLKKLPEKFS